MKRVFASLLMLCLLAACGSDDPRCATLPGGARYCLQDTAAIAPFDAQQKVVATVGDQRETMIVELEVDAKAMQVVGLTPFGQTVIQASYDNHAARAERWPDERLKPVQFLALLQIALWPAEAVRAGLDAALVLEESDGMRRVVQRGNLLLEVGYTGARSPAGHMHIAFPSMPMQFEITTLDEPAAP